MLSHREAKLLLSRAPPLQQGSADHWCIVCIYIYIHADIGWILWMLLSNIFQPCNHMQSMNGSSVPLQDSMILGERREILVLGLALAAHNSPSAMAYASVDISVSNPLSSILPRRRSELSKSIYTNLLTNSYYSPGFAFQHCAQGWVWIRGASAQLRISDMIPLNWPATMTICQLWDSHRR